MNISSETSSKNFIIKNELGLHARPAASIAKLAQTAKSKIWIVKDEDKVDASSVIDILTLACLQGTEITVKADDQSDSQILDKIAALIESGFGE